MSSKVAAYRYRRWGAWWRMGRLALLGVAGLVVSGCTVYDTDYPRYRYYGDHRVLIQSSAALLHTHVYHTTRSYRPVTTRATRHRHYRPPAVRPRPHTPVRRPHRPQPAPRSSP